MLRQIGWQIAIATSILMTFVGRGMAGTVDLNVMSFNVWSAEDGATGRQRIINTIEQAGADLVGFQEMGVEHSDRLPHRWVTTTTTRAWAVRRS